MTDRLSFFKRLRDDEIGDPSPPAAADSKGRKAYLQSLSGGASSTARGVAEMALVEFSVASISEYQGKAQFAAAYRQPAATPRVRPNYDNSRRKLFANPQPRQS